MKQILLTISALIITQACFCQYDSLNLINWKVYNLPIDSISLQKYNWSPDNWIVYDSNSSVYAKEEGRSYYIRDLPFELHPSQMNENVYFLCPKAIIKVDDGYLISFYRGEFGGYLYWFSADGMQKKQVSRALITQFIERDNKIFAIEGLDHMGMNLGDIVELKKKDQNWTKIEYLELASTPYAVQKDSKNNFVIVTSDNLISVDPKGNITTIFKNGFWSILYPTSLVLNRENVFVGMRKGVFKFNTLTGQGLWLMKD